MITVEAEYNMIIRCRVVAVQRTGNGVYSVQTLVKRRDSTYVNHYLTIILNE